MNFTVEGIKLADQIFNCDSTQCSVKLEQLQPQTSGVYRCEISGDAPHFNLVSGTSNMSVAGKFYFFYTIHYTYTHYFLSLFPVSTVSDWNHLFVFLSHYYYYFYHHYYYYSVVFSDWFLLIRSMSILSFFFAFFSFSYLLCRLCLYSKQRQSKNKKNITLEREKKNRRNKYRKNLLQLLLMLLFLWPNLSFSIFMSYSISVS